MNCERKGHVLKECKQPKAEMAQRPCFICQKIDHIAKNCHKKDARPALAITDAYQAQIVDVLCYGICEPEVDSEGFQRIQHGNKPKPQGAQLGEFIVDNGEHQRQGEGTRLQALSVAVLDKLCDVVGVSPSVVDAWSHPNVVYDAHIVMMTKGSVYESVRGRGRQDHMFSELVPKTVKAGKFGRGID